MPPSAPSRTSTAPPSARRSSSSRKGTGRSVTTMFIWTLARVPLSLPKPTANIARRAGSRGGSTLRRASAAPLLLPGRSPTSFLPSLWRWNLAFERWCPPSPFFPSNSPCGTWRRSSWRRGFGRWLGTGASPPPRASVTRSSSAGMAGVPLTSRRTALLEDFWGLSSPYSTYSC